MTDPSRRPHPFWQVQAVFDPDGKGGDFGYTIGLGDRGVPELHLWGRPALGDDPGEDWLLSPPDTMRILNELAWEWLDGDLRVGDSFERDYDDGLVTLRFQVDPAQDSGSLEAYGAGNNPVVPIRWSLHRPAMKPAREMGHEQEEAANAEWALLRESLDDRKAPLGWALPARPSWALRQQWGPRTPLVLARAAQLWQADTEGLCGIVQVANHVASAGSLTYPCAVAQTASRSVGRHRRLTRLHDDITRLVEGLGTRWSKEEFAAMQATVLGSLGTSQEGPHHQANLRWLISHSLIAAATVEAVGDVLPERTMLHGLGPFLSGLVCPGEAPGPGWLAAPEVVSTVAAVLQGVSPATLVVVAREHERRREEADYEEVFGWLSARAATGPASCPDVLQQLVPQTRAAFVHLLLADGVALARLQEWGTALTAALVHRMELDPAWVRRFADPFNHVVPELARLLDNPIVGAA